MHNHKFTRVSMSRSLDIGTVGLDNNNNNNLRLLTLRQTAQPTMITTTACNAGEQQQGLARA